MPLIPTIVDPVAETRADILDTIVGAYRMLRGTFEHVQSQIWHNPRGLTPQQVLDALGSDAKELVELSTQVAMLVNAKCPKDQWLRSHAPTDIALRVNEDGTVTVQEA